MTEEERVIRKSKVAIAGLCKSKCIAIVNYAQAIGSQSDSLSLTHLQSEKIVYYAQLIQELAQSIINRNKETE